jgi:hypothetical protein
MQFVLVENTILSITKTSQLMLYRAVTLFIVHTLWVGVNGDMTDPAAGGTYTYHRGLNAECSPIHSADCTTLPSSHVTAQFICPVLP